MKHPDLLLVHGAWHGSWVFESLVPVLASQGFTVRTVDLPSSGSLVGLDADVKVVRDSLARHPSPTLVVAHSYGGVVISEACAGVRNVMGLAYLCAFVLDKGESLSMLLQPLPPWIAIDEAGSACRVLDPERIFYADVAPAIAAQAVARLRPQSLACLGTALTAAAWRELPSSYLLCEQDEAIVVPAQEALSARTNVVERLAASHSPFLSRPADVAAFIARAADRAVPR
ncbi:MAG TPA: alpha/beta hydrolase [Kofleriaceae bacterium]|nr:alpha/beta hydrolase [Kofleriaceae bacterium]